jgi:hypothetical protein
MGSGYLKTQVGLSIIVVSKTNIFKKTFPTSPKKDFKHVRKQ